MSIHDDTLIYMYVASGRDMLIYVYNYVDIYIIRQKSIDTWCYVDIDVNVCSIRQKYVDICSIKQKFVDTCTGTCIYVDICSIRQRYVDICSMKQQAFNIWKYLLQPNWIAFLWRALLNGKGKQVIVHNIYLIHVSCFLFHTKIKSYVPHFEALRSIVTRRELQDAEVRSSKWS